MLDQLAKLRFTRFRFQLRAETPLRLPAYAGSTLRGGFGIAFKEAVCVVEHGDCGRCILRSKCAYAYIFETPVPNGSRRMASYEHAPHPFVIEPALDSQTRYAKGDTLTFHLVLIGRAIDYLPYFIFAFEQLGERRGIGTTIQPQAERGPRRGRFSVESVEALNGSTTGSVVYTGRSKALRGELHPHTLTDSWSAPALRCQPSALQLEFLTPTRLIFDRELVTVPELHILIRNLLRRLSNLTYFHCDAELDLDFRGLIAAAEAVKLAENRTRWHDWERYSARQETKLKMGGVVGTVVYEGEVDAFAPLLALGEVVHVGKGTGLGLGRYGVAKHLVGGPQQ